MTKRVLFLFTVCTIIFSLSVAGPGKRRIVREQEPNESATVNPNSSFLRVPDPDWTNSTAAVGTFTTLTGFYDYQSNGGAVQEIRVNPANGNIHVTWMSASDSTAGLDASRRVRYAFSSNGGTAWNNFSNLTVPSRRAGFPSIDLLKGANAGLPVIANHSTITGTQIALFVDSPEGSGAFSELNAPPTITAGGSLEPIWPGVAGASDGSTVIIGTQNNQTLTTGVAYYNRLQNDFSTWGAWQTWPGDVQSGGRNVVQATGTGRVGILLNTSNGTAVLGNRWIESTDNGQSWTAPVNLFAQRYVGADTIDAYVHADFVYNGETPLYVFSEFKTSGGFVGEDDIVFWSQATGFKVIAPYDTTKYVVDPLNQRFHRDSHGWPSIGLSGNTIVVAYQGFQPDTDHVGWHYSDLWYVISTNSGTSWGSPQRITNTPTTDERYPSVSKWNGPGHFDMVWTLKNRSGLFAFPGSAQPPNPDTVRTWQVFLRINITDVAEGNGVANTFKLSQNYPNPFNPATNIEYTVAQAGPVNIKVYNTLGQEVATLLNENLAAGQYKLTFDGKNLPSGVYIYTMTAGSYSASKKMMLIK